MTQIFETHLHFTAGIHGEVGIASGQALWKAVAASGQVLWKIMHEDVSFSKTPSILSLPCFVFLIMPLDTVAATGQEGFLGFFIVSLLVSVLVLAEAARAG